jgi:transposase
LLERLKNFEKETLRFIAEVDVPFTNNLGENNIRMTKVQQKISGCFRSMEGAQMFCRIRSYISTYRKQGLSVTTALNRLFNDEVPDFMQKITQ